MDSASFSYRNDLVPEYKVDIKEEQPFLIKYCPDYKDISLVKVKGVSTKGIEIGNSIETPESLINGFYYGTLEFKKLKEDILDNYKNFFI